MKFNFLPKEDSFFQQFERQASFDRDAGAMLLNLMEDFDNMGAHLEALNELERQGDHVVHEIARDIAKSFVTPIDREDIHALSANLDDILDFIQSSAVCMVTYQIEKPTTAALRLAEIIKEATEIMYEAVERFIALTDVSDLRRRIKDLEHEADNVEQSAVADLFKNEKDAIELIKWKEIYSSLENVTDKCKDVMDVLESIVLKYA
ncbi:MAG: DUF47 domain-containing protein [Candidatus Bruticola sp.]